MRFKSANFKAGIIFMVLGVLVFTSPLIAAKWEILPSVTIPQINLFHKPGGFEVERTDGKYYTIIDQYGKTIHQTAMGVFVGDEFIAGDNKRYRITKVHGDTAYAKQVGVEKIVWLDERDSIPAVASVPAQGGQNRIGIYHTHSDESYVPTDGRASIYGNGGIFKVGAALAEGLKNQGLQVDHSYNAHDPHDANAYYRSRRTALQLLKNRPLALIDVHRDAVPPQVYQANVNGQPVTQIKLVVGRQNQNMAANMDFAKKMKAYLDKTQPGLVEGIFIAKGNYNQDLTPRAILIEAGSHTNSRINAQRGVELFAQAVPKVLGVSAVDTTPTQRTGDWTGLLWVLGALLIGGGAFLLISTGSLEGAANQLRNFGSKEFADFFGRLRPARKPERKDGDEQQ